MDNGEDKIIDRIFEQIDVNTGNILELTKITSNHSSTINILKKISITILIFILISSLSLIFGFVKGGIDVDVSKNKTAVSEYVTGGNHDKKDS